MPPAELEALGVTEGLLIYFNTYLFPEISRISMSVKSAPI